MTTERESDEKLMARLVQGETDSLAELLRRYGTPLLTFLRRMIGDRSRAEEIFQDVFLAVWLKRRQYKAPRRFKPWLYTIAMNKCREIWRLKKIRLGQMPQEEIVSQWEVNAAEAAMSSETAIRVKMALGSLTEQQRAVVLLRIWDDLSYADLAPILGCSEATARSHMRQALSALKVRLGPHLHELHLPDGIRIANLHEARPIEAIHALPEGGLVKEIPDVE